MLPNPCFGDGEAGWYRGSGGAPPHFSEGSGPGSVLHLQALPASCLVPAFGLASPAGAWHCREGLGWGPGCFSSPPPPFPSRSLLAAEELKTQPL